MSLLGGEWEEILLSELFGRVEVIGGQKQSNRTM